MKDKRYIIGVIAAIVVAIIAIILIVGRPGSNRSPQTGEPGAQAAINLSNYANRNSRTEYTTQGRIVGENQFQAVRISVTPTERRVDVINGYDGKVVSTQTFPNTTAAYATFLEALKQAGYSNSKESAIEDYRGVCPLGRRYVYTLIEPGDTVFESWSTSCGRTGSFAGNAGLTRQLFQNQIPEYNRVTSTIRL